MTADILVCSKCGEPLLDTSNLFCAPDCKVTYICSTCAIKPIDCFEYISLEEEEHND